MSNKSIVNSSNNSLSGTEKILFASKALYTATT
jgi:hypothetical protein